MFIDLPVIYTNFKIDINDAFKYLKNKIFQLNQVDFDVLINFNFSKLSAIFTSLIEANLKIGANLLDSENIFIANRYLRSLFFEIDKCETKEHILNFFFKALNIKHKDFYIPSSNQDKNNFILTIHPGASEEKKKWGIKNYIKLLKILNNDFNNLKVFITGGKLEIKENLFLENELKKLKIETLNFTGKLNFKQVLDVIANSDLLISSDTSIAHLGALTLTNSITIFLGGAYHYHTFPYQYNKIVVYPDISCYPCKVREKCNFNFQCKKVITPELLKKIVLKEKNFNNCLKTVKKEGYFCLQ